MLLACIADDFTGATDLAGNLARAGMRVVQTIGVPAQPLQAEVDAVVVALKSRTIAPQDAIVQSLAALRWLRVNGGDKAQVYFKVCSTFDSTDQGNIGPVTEALMDALGCDFTIVCPAFPENGRTVFKGYLFVGDELLSESGMRNHPLTPMTDANLVRVLQRQVQRTVGLIGHVAIAGGGDAIAAQIAALKTKGVGIAIVDAVSNGDLMRLGAAIKNFPLIVAGSGVAIGLPQNFGIAPCAQAASLPVTPGPCAIVSGSCSAATNAQVAAHLQAGRPAFVVNPLRLAVDEDVVGDALRWAAQQSPEQPLLVYSTADPQAVKTIQSQIGAERAGEITEAALAAIARGLIDGGVRNLIVAGGETSGAVVQALGITQLRIGPQIDPGVPWCGAAVNSQAVRIALKSGNFGTEDFFIKAFTL